MITYRYMVNGPSLSFSTDSSEDAERILQALGVDRDDFTVTDTDPTKGGYIYSAMDADGRIWCYSDQPFLGEYSWGTYGKEPLLIAGQHGDVSAIWQNSLRRLEPSSY